ncbi:MAG: hypothetical protein ACRD1L_03395 [Terriglobales bacterium]
MKRRSEDGYALLVVLLALCLLVLALARAVPDWKTQVQREREARTIDHAREYRTAIRRYFHKYGRYPPSLDALTQADGQGLHYLREAWPDPLNMKGDADGSWQLLHYGQAVTAKIVDQPPAAAITAAGAGIAGPNLAAGAGGPPAAAPGAAFAATLGAGVGQAPSLASGAGAGVTSGPGANLGGGPIIGVASLNKQPAVHAFNGFSTPNDWQFVYNYGQDPTLRTGPAAVPGASAAPGGLPLGLGMGPASPVHPGGGY